MSGPSPEVRFPDAPAAQLRPGACDVWQIDLDGAVADARTLSLLGEEERQRAGRFHRRIHRQRFAACHAALRILLGRYLDVPAAELVFDADRWGRPRLSQSSGADALDFNLSHSEGIATVAVALNGPVGMDVEVRRPAPDAIALAERYFTAEERVELRAQESSGLADAFLTCWTRKEAILKGIGVGLTVDPASIEVGVSRSCRRMLVRAGEGEAAFALVSLAFGESAIGAVAVPASCRILSVFPLRTVHDL